MSNYKDRAVQSSLSTGTGDFSLDASQSCFQNLPEGQVFYLIENCDQGEWEVGCGTVTTGVLTRDNVRDGSSGVGITVDFTAGTKNVKNVAPAFFFESFEALTLGDICAGTLQLDATQLSGNLPATTQVNASNIIGTITAPTTIDLANVNTVNNLPASNISGTANTSAVFDGSGVLTSGVVATPFQVGDLKYSYATTNHNGWYLLNGDATVGITDTVAQANATALFGANLPNLYTAPHTLVTATGGTNPSNGDTYNLGDTGGSEAHQLQVNELPNYRMDIDIPIGEGALDATIGGRVDSGAQSVGAPAITQPDAVPSDGNDDPHNNMPPYLAANIFIFLDSI